MLMQSYDMLFDKHVAVQSSPSYRYCRPGLVSSKQDSGRAEPEKVCCVNTKVGFPVMLIQSDNMLLSKHVAV